MEAGFEQAAIRHERQVPLKDSGPFLRLRDYGRRAILAIGRVDQNNVVLHLDRQAMMRAA